MSNVVKEIKRIDDTVVVVASGELTFEQSPAFHASLIEICDQSPNKLIINLSEVRHIDSSGVGTLTEIYRRVKNNNASMSLVGMNKMVRSVFEITRLDHLFSIFETEEEALKS